MALSRSPSSQKHVEKLPAAGQIHQHPGKTATAAPRYWINPTPSILENMATELLASADEGAEAKPKAAEAERRKPDILVSPFILRSA